MNAVIELNPSDLEHCESLLSSGRVEDALAHYKALMKDVPDQYHLWVNYASFLHRAGRYEEAVKIAQKANNLQPSAEGFHNLASSYHKLGRMEEAIETYKRALIHNPEFVASHHDLAILYAIQNRYDHALDHIQIAATIEPNDLKNWFQLALLRHEAGRHREALSACRQALKVSKEADPGILSLCSRIFSVEQDFDVTPQLVELVTLCLQSSLVNTNNLRDICFKLYKHQPLIKKLIKSVNSYEFDDFEGLLSDKTLNWGVLNHTLFIEMLKKVLVCDLEIENILTALRFHLLAHAHEGKTPEQLFPAPLLFVSALACQCFLNEYVFFETEPEVDMLKVLENKLIKGEPTPYDVALYGCYRPLRDLPGIESLTQRLSCENQIFADLMREQVEEPAQERLLKEQITEFTSIDDAVSQLVKAQYEVNPYPRWIQASKMQALPFMDSLRYYYRCLDPKEFEGIQADKPDVLIAGCGTGKQVVLLTNAHEYSHITAVDISLSSLAYAARKAQERAIENIDFGVADILKLGELNTQFDVVYCTGVLHHMDDPLAGWRVLTECTKPGGFQMIALYSEIARAPVIAARKFIAEHGHKSDLDGIRNCREFIKSMPEGHPMYPVARWGDFYSTSAIRDLLFHEQEHRYTIPQLKKELDELGLKFLGFYFSSFKPLRFYRAQFPDDPHGLNLDNWETLEQQNPSLFLDMYQFWVKKNP